MKRIFKLAALLSLCGPFLLSSSVRATTITINYIGSGYTDPTPVEPVGGNPGTTLGEQRRNAVRFAADIWQAALNSDVEIKINSSFSLLTCGVLAQTGTGQYGFDFPEAPFPNTLYHGALANKLHGSDLFSGAANMTVTFNSGYDTTCGGGWYYGYDNNHGTSFDVIAVSLHEFGHGLGFSTPTSSTTGAFFLGRPSIYDRLVFDNTQGLHWHEMPTNANRVTSAIDFRNVVWDGPQVTGAVSGILQLGFPFLQVNSPKSIAGNYVDTAASFGPRLPNDGITANVVLADDGVPPTSDACEPLINGKEINGNIALIDRGNCNFTVKVKNAQDAGAIGVIMVNNMAGTPIAMGGIDPTITTPSVMVSQSDGNAIRAELGNGVNTTLALDLSLRSGTDANGRALLYTPIPVASGSTISHWDSSAYPHLLLTPSYAGDQTHDLDLTIYELLDIGW